MFFKILIVFTLFSSIKTATTKHLVELPLKVPAKSAVINATLTDVTGNKKYFIQELISASGLTIKGKISISSDKDSYTIHHDAISITGMDMKERLVIHGKDCSLFTYKDSWDKTLPGIDKPLLNLILLMGPSIVYRIDHSSFVWKSVEDKNIRGIMMKGAATEINKRLKITFYYKYDFSEQDGILNPSRIEFSGYDPASSAIQYKENLILDIYLKDELDSDTFQNEVQPLPGIGCPHYLSEYKQFPALRAFHLRYTMDEHIQGSTTSRTRSEIHAAQYYGFLRLKASLLGSMSEIIYDYQLGVSFLVEEGGSCSIVSVDKNTPGIDSYGTFTLSSLFMLDGDFKYLGMLNLEHRSGIPVEAWESVQFNVNINGKTADRAVITQYFAQSRHDDIFWDYTLVSTQISIYKYDPTKKVYTWTDEITRDYLNFQEARFEESLAPLINQCKYLTSDKKLTLHFILGCDVSDTSYDSCIKHTEDRVTWLKGDFTYFILLARPVSLLRIEDIQYQFTDSKVEMHVTFSDKPDFSYIYKPHNMSVSQETTKKMQLINAHNELECLQSFSQFQDLIKAVIYRYSDGLCGYLSETADLKEDTKQGQRCSVYLFPLNNLHRVGQELALEQIHDAYLQDVGQSFSLFDGSSSIPFKLLDVIDQTKKGPSSAPTILQIKTGAKLKTDDQLTSFVQNVKSYSDCYLACHNSEQLVCSFFSFCDTDGVIDCRVSSMLYDDIAKDESHIEPDKKCNIFSIDVLNDYTKVRNRKFKTPVSASVENYFYQCAESCHSSPDCVSFQYCDGSCSFNGFYSDAATEYDEGCSVFYPKAAEKYQKTGNKIVSDALHTEMNLNLDQCASLCNRWSDGDIGCKSFNYCPKSRTESSCSLTQFSVKSPDTKTTQGGDCSNYEIKVESNGKKSKESSATEVMKGTSGTGAFGIIMLFMFVGALAGFMAPFAYSKVKQMHDASKANEDFLWTRQVDEK